jgi:hypothetical protein
MFAHVPPFAPFPAEHHGKLSVALLAAHSGDPDEGREALAPVVQQGEPILAGVQPVPYVALQSSFDAGTPDGARYYWKSHYMNALGDDAIDALVGYVDRMPGPLSIVGFEPMGGAINRVAPDATAFPHRQAAFAFGAWCGWTDPAQDDEVIGWTRGLHEVMTPFATGGVYVNYLDDDEADRNAGSFGANHARLQAIKTKYDPENVFRLNQNLEPSAP